MCIGDVWVCMNPLCPLILCWRRLTIIKHEPRNLLGKNYTNKKEHEYNLLLENDKKNGGSVLMTSLTAR